MKEKPTVIAVVNQKGGTAKTTTVENLGIGLAREGKKVLLVDTDPQGSLTISLGYPRPDELDITLFDLLNKTINEDSVSAGEGILHQAEGICMGRFFALHQFRLLRLCVLGDQPLRQWLELRKNHGGRAETATFHYSEKRGKTGRYHLLPGNLQHIRRKPRCHLCGRRNDDPLREPNPVCFDQFKLLAGSFLLFRQAAVRKGE